MTNKKQYRKLYTNQEWLDYSKKVRDRDGNKCLQCGRNDSQVCLQVHHQKYIRNKLIWEYALSDCVTLCKGCHAREHGILEPSHGWTLLSIEDSGDLNDICERPKCVQRIRYLHEAYHPKVGTRIVGSTCIDFLTQEDKLISGELLKIYKKISKLVEKSHWDMHFTVRTNFPYLATRYKKDYQIRLYGKDIPFSFQLVEIKVKKKKTEYIGYGKSINVKVMSVNQAAELAFICVLGKEAGSEEEKALLRNLYWSLKSTTTSI